MFFASLRISGCLLVITLGSLSAERNHPDCDSMNVITNFARMCASYALWKRSTTNNHFVEADFGNDIGQWQPDDGLVPYGRNVAANQPHLGWYPQSPKGQQRNGETQLYVRQENLDPIYFESEEVLATLERWRRNKDVEGRLTDFINHCCHYGCPFPVAYLEVEKGINMCSLRSGPK